MFLVFLRLGQVDRPLYTLSSRGARTALLRRTVGRAGYVMAR